MSLLKLLEHGQIEQAQTRAEDRLSQLPQDVEARLTLARLLAAEGKLEAAEQMLRQLVADGELGRQIRLTELALLSARQQYAQATEGYRQLPESPESTYGLASSLAHQGLYAEALPYFQRLTELVPEQGRFYYHLGRNFLELEQPAEAFEALAEALEKDPYHADTYLVLSRSLGAVGQQAKALELLQWGLRLMPEQPHLSNELANLQLLLGRLEEAADTSSRLAASLPENLPAQANFALSLLAQGRFTEVVELCRRTQKSAALWSAQAAALEQMERLPEAVEAYQQAGQYPDCDWSTLNNWGLLLLRLGQDEQAERVLLRARSQAPGQAEPCLNLALVWARHPEGRAQALELLEELLQRSRLTENLRTEALRLQAALSC